MRRAVVALLMTLGVIASLTPVASIAAAGRSDLPTCPRTARPTTTCDYKSDYPADVPGPKLPTVSAPVPTTGGRVSQTFVATAPQIGGTCVGPDASYAEQRDSVPCTVSGLYTAGIYQGSDRLYYPFSSYDVTDRTICLGGVGGGPVANPSDLGGCLSYQTTIEYDPAQFARHFPLSSRRS